MRRKIKNLIEFSALVFSTLVGCGAVIFLIAMALMEMKFGYVTLSEHNGSAVFVNLIVLVPSLPLLAFFSYKSLQEVKKE
jgi:hypothetical protein